MFGVGEVNAVDDLVRRGVTVRLPKRREEKERDEVVSPPEGYPQQHAPPRGAAANDEGVKKEARDGDDGRDDAEFKEAGRVVPRVLLGVFVCHYYSICLLFRLAD